MTFIVMTLGFMLVIAIVLAFCVALLSGLTALFSGLFSVCSNAIPVLLAVACFLLLMRIC